MFTPSPNCKLDANAANTLIDIIYPMMDESRTAYDKLTDTDDYYYAAGVHDGLFLVLKQLGIEPKHVDEKIIESETMQAIGMNHWTK